MASFHFDRLLPELDRSGERYLEFLRVPALSAGLYRLRAGAEDTQHAHAEDEIYYALSGQARVRVGAQDHPVQAGTVLYVAAREDHRFHDITQDLTLLVVFAPAEGSSAASQ